MSYGKCYLLLNTKFILYYKKNNVNVLFKTKCFKLCDTNAKYWQFRLSDVVLENDDYKKKSLLIHVCHTYQY